MSMKSKARRNALRQGTVKKTAASGESAGLPLQEDPSNIQALCPCCVKKRHQAFQSGFGQEERLALKRHVDSGGWVQIKAPFVDDSMTEHMWVKVLAVNLINGMATGTLNNAPCLVRTVQEGDLVQVDLNSVEGLDFGKKTVFPGL